VQKLLTGRHREVTPRLAGAVFGEARATDDGLLTANWRMGDGAALHLLANLSGDAAEHPSEVTGTPIWGGEAGTTIPPWSVFWRLDAR
jgi:maltooligosyltrehalose trehalohydrolase